MPQDPIVAWAAEPLGLARLEGEESDREDSVLKVVRTSFYTVELSSGLDSFPT